MDGGSIAVAITGIVVSGIAGPYVTSRFTRGSEQRNFDRDTRRRDRDELRDVLDTAAALLSEGPRVLRRFADAPQDASRQAAVHEWAEAVFPMRERLALRLPADDRILTAYDSVRDAAKKLTENGATDEAVTAYETARDGYLAAARVRVAAAATGLG